MLYINAETYILCRFKRIKRHTGRHMLHTYVHIQAYGVIDRKVHRQINMDKE